MLTAKQHELIQFIQQRLEETGISPSFEEMKEALDLKSKSGVHRLISALEERGFIRRLPNRARALEVIKQPEASTPAGRQVAANAPANDVVSKVTNPPRRRPQPMMSLRSRCMAGSLQVLQSRLWKDRVLYLCQQLCWVRVSTMPWKFQATL